LYFKNIKRNAENFSHNISKTPTRKLLKDMAKLHNVYVVGGSIPEIINDGKLYNSSLVYDRKGKLILHYRKAHLFDVDIPGKITYKESDTYNAGN